MFDRDETIKKIAIFLEKNYPCKCTDDPECPGEIYEAEAIMDILMNDLAKS